MKTFLTLSHIRQLNANLTDTNTDLIISTLKLFNSMTNFAGGIEKRSIMDGFAWGQKVQSIIKLLLSLLMALVTPQSLQKLLFLRGKGKGVRGGHILAHPGICTVCIL